MQVIDEEISEKYNQMTKNLFNPNPKLDGRYNKRIWTWLTCEFAHEELIDEFIRKVDFEKKHFFKSKEYTIGRFEEFLKSKDLNIECLETKTQQIYTWLYSKFKHPSLIRKYIDRLDQNHRCLLNEYNMSIISFEDFLVEIGEDPEVLKDTREPEPEDQEEGLPKTTLEQRIFPEFTIKKNKKVKLPSSSQEQDRIFKSLLEEINRPEYFKNTLDLLTTLCTKSTKILAFVMKDKRYLTWDPYDLGMLILRALKLIMQEKIDVEIEKQKKNQEELVRKRKALMKARKGRDITVPARIKNHGVFSKANCLLHFLFYTKRFLKLVMQYRPNYDVMTQTNRMANYHGNQLKNGMEIDVDKSTKIVTPVVLPTIAEKTRRDPRSQILDPLPKKPKPVEIQIFRRYGVKLILAMQKLFAFMLRGNDFQVDSTEVLENIIDKETGDVFDFSGKLHRVTHFYDSFWTTFNAGFELNKNVKGPMGVTRRCSMRAM